MPLFEAECLSRVFRSRTSGRVAAVKDVSLQIPAGGVTALTGPSGSGKTTLLSLLGALDRPTAGKLSYGDQRMDGCSDAQLTRWRREMGFIYQDFALLPHLSVLDNVLYPLIPRGIDPAARQARARQRLQQFQLLDQAKKRAAELSGGEMQRLAVARALAADPKVLLADEPTSNLDQQNTELVLAAFETLRTTGTTLILATHDAQLLQMATQTIRLNGGRRVDDQ